MDLNAQYTLHQKALMLAQASNCGEHRQSLRREARGIAGRIARFQQTVGAAAARGWVLAS
ncbi:MAG: hypothetical protein ACK442_10520 [Novosphingobium sp.]|jgi:hypothetical protein|nr:hypothetical protein [Novosphingobium sp.]